MADFFSSQLAQRLLVGIMLLPWIVSISRCQDTTSPDVEINFTVPKNWKKLNDSVFELKNYEKEFGTMSRSLANGHMPWRLEPKNTADHLDEVKHGTLYSLKVDSATYIVYIKNKKYKQMLVPTATRLEIRHALRNGG